MVWRHRQANKSVLLLVFRQYVEQKPFRDAADLRTSWPPQNIFHHSFSSSPAHVRPVFISQISAGFNWSAATSHNLGKFVDCDLVAPGEPFGPGFAVSDVARVLCGVSPISESCRIVIAAEVFALFAHQCFVMMPWRGIAITGAFFFWGFITWRATSEI